MKREKKLTPLRLDLHRPVKGPRAEAEESEGEIGQVRRCEERAVPVFAEAVVGVMDFCLKKTRKLLLATLVMIEVKTLETGVTIDEIRKRIDELGDETGKEIILARRQNG